MSGAGQEGDREPGTGESNSSQQQRGELVGSLMESGPSGRHPLAAEKGELGATVETYQEGPTRAEEQETHRELPEEQVEVTQSQLEEQEVTQPQLEEQEVTQPQLEEQEKVIQPQVEGQEAVTQPQVEGQEAVTQPQVEGQEEVTQPQLEQQEVTQTQLEEQEVTQPQLEEQEVVTQPQVEEQQVVTQPQVEEQEEEDAKSQEGDEQQDSESQESPRDKVEDDQAREALVQEYHALVSEREKVQQQNAQLQHKLYEYFRRKKGEEARLEVEKHISDQEQRYLKYLAILEEMRKKYKVDAAWHEKQIEELRTQCQEVVSQIDSEWAAFQEQKKKIVVCGVSRRGTGKHAASSFAQEVEQLQSREDRKEKEVIQVRLENIKLKNQIHRYESTLRSKEELAEGLHLIDFEQLKIENQTYNEKIEERNEELLKLRKKITNTVQVLTHVKEKLQFVQAENQEQKERLMEVEALVANKRDILTKTKQARDSLRSDNLKLKQKCGLLGNKVLLRDFEDKVDVTEELTQTLENLKRLHAELTLTSKGIMKKIEEAKSVMEA